MKTYRNDTAEPITITVQTGDNTREYILPPPGLDDSLMPQPGGMFSFDDTAANGAEIENQLKLSGATPV